ncbi:MAG: DUF4956 domain-containing protein [Clostridiales bacterium]|nr:DUF4956 domain-containing protein [Clostridiales bacterium]
MLNELFGGLFDTAATTISVQNFIICIAAALILGLVTALSYRFKSTSTKSFMLTLAILPALVTVVIMLVNGNVGAGVAVAGAFSLVRFRSAQGSAREIAAIFLAMGIGLITGMGYIGYAVLFTLVMCAALMIYTAAGFGDKTGIKEKTLRITIPENLDYDGVFDEVLNTYTSKADLISVKTSNMGSLFKLKYDVTLKKDASEKEFIDKIRERNGNLEVSMSIRDLSNSAEL